MSLVKLKGEGFIQLDVAKEQHIENVKWEAAKMALVKRMKVVFVFNDENYEITSEQAKEIVNEKSIKDKIQNLRAEIKSAEEEIEKEMKFLIEYYEII